MRLPRFLLAAWASLSVTLPVALAAEGKAIGVGPAQRPETGGNRWAVIIGINDYQHVPKLRYCVADAKLLYDALSLRAGFDKRRMLLLTDEARKFAQQPTRDNLLHHLAEFLSVAEARDTVLVFFSGHGFKDDEGRGYLAPIDADPQRLALECVPVAEVKRLLLACKARQKVLILDTCHARTAKGVPLDTRIAVGARKLLEQVAAKGFVTLASCGPDQQSHESDMLRHGVFSYFVADALGGKADRDGDGWIDFDEIYRHAYDATRLWVYKEKGRRQEPLKDVRVQGVMRVAKVRRAGTAPPSFTNSIGMSMVTIKPGTFLMGSPDSEEGRSKDEGPQHRVRISTAFCMSAHEVTQGQYEKVMGTNPSYFKKGGNYPVEHVSWDDAVEFCKKLSGKEGRTYRLPTEAEWEYACRAGTTTPFAFGETISTEQANYDGNYTYGRGTKGQYRECTTAVGSFKPNAWGLYDMHGNVWEWCQDWYAEDAYRRSAEVDPTGPDGGSYRVLRGGSWIDYPRYCRSANRIRLTPVYRRGNYGFRVVCVVGIPAR